MNIPFVKPEELESVVINKIISVYNTFMEMVIQVDCTHRQYLEDNNTSANYKLVALRLTEQYFKECNTK